MVWAPEVYLNFAAYRARPVADLLPRLPPPPAGAIYDLGCGPGNVTAQLKSRWPDHAVVGVDSSQEMLDAAHKAHREAGIAWALDDISRWAPTTAAAMVFANASLQWVAAHKTLFPRLMGALAPRGVLAVQMPTGQRAPYQTTIDTVAAQPRWSAALSKAQQQTMPLSAGAYYDLLQPFADEIEIWETDYHHVLTGKDPVVAWVAGTALVPYTSLLEADEAADFVAAYAEAVRPAYPPQADGRTLFTMRRMFIVARRTA